MYSYEEDRVGVWTTASLSTPQYCLSVSFFSLSSSDWVLWFRLAVLPLLYGLVSLGFRLELCEKLIATDSAQRFSTIVLEWGSEICSWKTESTGPDTELTWTSLPALLSYEHAQGPTWGLIECSVYLRKSVTWDSAFPTKLQRMLLLLLAWAP